jgi:hypothetical protein
VRAQHYHALALYRIHDSDKSNLLFWVGIQLFFSEGLNILNKLLLANGHHTYFNIGSNKLYVTFDPNVGRYRSDIGPISVSTSGRYRSTLQNWCRADIGGLFRADIVDQNGPISARCKMFVGLWWQSKVKIVHEFKIL